MGPFDKNKDTEGGEGPTDIPVDPEAPEAEPAVGPLDDAEAGAVASTDLGPGDGSPDSDVPLGTLPGTGIPAGEEQAEEG